MVSIDDYRSVGDALELLAQSEYHRQHPMSAYLRTNVLPAFSVPQARFYVNEAGMPTAMITWAWLSPPVEAKVHETRRALRNAEWNCGKRLFFNDWVRPDDNIREVVQDMTHVVFPDEVATSLRRNRNVTVQRINCWTGANLRRARAEVMA